MPLGTSTCRHGVRPGSIRARVRRAFGPRHRRRELHRLAPRRPPGRVRRRRRRGRRLQQRQARAPGDARRRTHRRARPRGSCRHARAAAPMRVRLPSRCSPRRSWLHRGLPGPDPRQSRRSTTRSTRPAGSPGRSASSTRARHVSTPPCCRPPRSDCPMLAEEQAGFDRPGNAFPEGAYGWCKLMGEFQLEQIANSALPSRGAAARIFSAYGERENESHAVIALIAKAALRLDPFPVWGTGRQVRNFTYVADTVTGLLLLGALRDSVRLPRGQRRVQQPLHDRRVPRPAVRAPGLAAGEHPERAVARRRRRQPGERQHVDPRASSTGSRRRASRRGSKDAVLVPDATRPAHECGEARAAPARPLACAPRALHRGRPDGSQRGRNDREYDPRVPRRGRSACAGRRRSWWPRTAPPTALAMSWPGAPSDQDGRVRLTPPSQQKGYSRAVADAYRLTRRDVVVCCDGDGQYDPGDLPRLLDALSPGVVVAGARSPRRDSRSRLLASWAFGRVYRLLTGVRMKDPSSSFVAAFRRDVLSVLPATPVLPQGFWWEFFARADAAGLRILEVPVSSSKTRRHDPDLQAAAAAADRPRPSRRARPAPERAEASPGRGRSSCITRRRQDAVSSTPRDSAAGLPAVRQQVAAWAAIGATLMIAVGFAFMAVESFRQIDHLVWRLAEIPRMVSAGASLATPFRCDSSVLVLGSVAVMLAAEYRPRGLVRVSTAVWVSVGVAGTGAYLLSTLDAGTRWAFAMLLGASVVVAVLVARLPLLQPEDPGRFTRPEGSARRRPVLPVAVGLVGGLLAVRASIEPVTEWDALIYHVSFARDWIASLPGLPHAAGPSVGAELSYNYPALFPSISVAFAGALHVGVSSVARIISPLAAITVLARPSRRGAVRALPGLGGADVPARQHVLRRVRRLADRLHADDRADRSRGRAARGREAVDAGDGPVHRPGCRDRADRHRLRPGRPCRFLRSRAREAHARPYRQACPLGFPGGGGRRGGSASGRSARGRRRREPSEDGRRPLPVADLAPRPPIFCRRSTGTPPSTRSSPTRTASSTPRSEASARRSSGSPGRASWLPGVSLCSC